jgi:hypothetical protein
MGLDEKFGPLFSVFFAANLNRKVRFLVGIIAYKMPIWHSYDLNKILSPHKTPM